MKWLITCCAKSEMSGNRAIVCPQVLESVLPSVRSISNYYMYATLAMHAYVHFSKRSALGRRLGEYPRWTVVKSDGCRMHTTSMSVLGPNTRHRGWRIRSRMGCPGLRWSMSVHLSIIGGD